MLSMIKSNLSLPNHPGQINSCYNSPSGRILRCPSKTTLPRKPKPSINRRRRSSLQVPTSRASRDLQPRNSPLNTVSFRGRGVKQWPAYHQCCASPVAGKNGICPSRYQSVDYPQPTTDAPQRLSLCLISAASLARALSRPEVHLGQVWPGHVVLIATA